MKVCIIGAGAIGGFIGAKLSAAGQCATTALARGATLAALREHGWRLRTADGRMIAGPVTASDRADALGPQDLIVITVKGPALPAVAATIAPLLGPDTIVLPAMNGVPWWFCQGMAGVGDAPLQSVDPGGTVAEAIALPRVIGCVVHASTSTPEPGLVQQKMGQRLIIGEPTGGRSERASRIAALFSSAGFDVDHSADVRQDIWYKLWGNMTMNPVSAITGATMDRILDDELVRDFCSSAMREAQAIGAKIGCPIAETPQDRHAVTRKLGVFKSSMLQDVEAGRPLELDSLVTAVRELGERVGIATPNIDALLGLTRLFGRGRGLYPPA